MCQAEVVMKLSQKLVKETKKKTVAREKAEENERAAAGSTQAKSEAAADQEDYDDEPGPITAGGWLAPETRVTRRKARLMRGARSPSVEVLEADEIGHLSAARRYVKAGRFSCPHPFGRRLMEDRWARGGRPRGDWISMPPLSFIRRLAGGYLSATERVEAGAGVEVTTRTTEAASCRVSGTKNGPRDPRGASNACLLCCWAE